MNALLNKHLRGRFPEARPCEEWTSAGVQEFLANIHPHLSVELEHVYDASSDRRSAAATARPTMPLREHQKVWKTLEKAANVAGGSAPGVLRDAFCIEAALWLVHHTPSAAADALHPAKVPLLPKAPRTNSELSTSEDDRKVWQKYEDTHFCTICHGSGTPFLPPGSDPAAPKWPPPVAPSMPFQFESDMTGWMIDKYIQPGGANITSGRWHYDFHNNRLRLDYKARPSKFPAKLWPLEAQIRMIWLGDPTPPSEANIPTEVIYGKGAERGYAYMFIKPQPFLPWKCTRAAKPGMGVIHPDMFSWGSNFQGQYDTHVPVNVTFVGREWIEGQWGDHYYLDYHDVSNPNCVGPFELWKSIDDNAPISDTGVVDCGRGNGRAYTHWYNLKPSMPDPSLFTKGITWEPCQDDPSLEHMEKRLRAEFAESEDANVRQYAAEAASLARATLHHGMGHAFMPRELLGDERFAGRTEELVV